jgi:amino acid permease
MIVLILIALGAFAGVAYARRRQGNRLDKLQYASVFGIIAGILGLFLTLIIERMF